MEVFSENQGVRSTYDSSSTKTKKKWALKYLMHGLSCCLGLVSGSFGIRNPLNYVKLTKFNTWLLKLITIF